jgi:hypothetical protein
VRILPFLAFATACSLWSPASQARVAVDTSFDGTDVLLQSELRVLRGGMMIGGIPIDFAVIVSTTVTPVGGGTPTGLQTTLAVNNSGQLASAVTTPIGDGSGTVQQTAGNGLAMAIKGNETAIMQRVINGQIESLVQNRASDRIINHHTDYNVTIPGMLGLAQTWTSRLTAARVNIDAGMMGLGRY